MINKYLSNLFKTYQKGDAREESYYQHLADFITLFSESKRKKKIDVTILPKKTEAGDPDFRIWEGRQKIIGYVEDKDLGTDLCYLEFLLESSKLILDSNSKTLLKIHRKTQLLFMLLCLMLLPCINSIESCFRENGLA